RSVTDVLGTTCYPCLRFAGPLLCRRFELLVITAAVTHVSGLICYPCIRSVPTHVLPAPSPAAPFPPSLLPLTTWVRPDPATQVVGGAGSGLSPLRNHACNHPEEGRRGPRIS